MQHAPDGPAVRAGIAAFHGGGAVGGSAPCPARPGLQTAMKSTRNYPLLLASQFLGAFGDNAILSVILGQLTVLQKQGAITPEVLRERGALYTSLLFIPYILLAPLAGFLNDRFPKTHWLAGGNAVKLLGTVVCALSIWFGYAWQAPGYIIVGIGSCFYGPAKYGILPEILPAERLVKANGMVELLTLCAIITGNVAGALMADHLPLTACYAVLVGIFGLSLALNLPMDRTPSNPSVRLSPSVAEFGRHAVALYRSPRLGRVLVGTALFWVCGAAMKINFQAWGLGVLGLANNTALSMLGLWLAVGVMGGSLLAGRLHRVGDLASVRRYAAGIVATLVLLWTVEHLAFWRGWAVGSGVFRLFPWVVLLLVASGVAAGLFLIPLNAALQAESDPGRLGKTIAVQNLSDNVGMLLAGGLVIACTRSGDWFGLPITAGGVFLVLGILVAAASSWLRLADQDDTARSRA